MTKDVANEGLNNTHLGVEAPKDKSSCILESFISTAVPFPAVAESVCSASAPVMGNIDLCKSPSYILFILKIFMKYISLHELQ